MVLVSPSSQLLATTWFGSDGNVHLWEDQPRQQCPPLRHLLHSPWYYLYLFAGTPSLKLVRPFRGCCWAAASVGQGSCKKFCTDSSDKSHQWVCRSRHSEAGKHQSWGHTCKLHLTALCIIVMIQLLITHRHAFFLDCCHTQCQHNLSCVNVNF